MGANDRGSVRGRQADQRRGRAASQDRSNGASDHRADDRLQGDDAPAAAEDEQTVSVAEAARLLGRDRIRVYALLRPPARAAPARSAAGPEQPLSFEAGGWHTGQGGMSCLLHQRPSSSQTRSVIALVRSDTPERHWL